MRRALLYCAAIVLAIACGDYPTEAVPDRAPVTSPAALKSPTIAFATTTTEDGLTINTDKDDYAPGDTVHFTGSGWPANDVLDIVLVDDLQKTHTWSVSTAVDGTFQDSTYVVDEADLGVTFTLVATSRATGRSLTVVFTDGNFSYKTSPGNLFATLNIIQRSGTTCSAGGSPTTITLSYNVNGSIVTGVHYDLTIPAITGYTYDGYTSSGNVTITPASATSNSVLCIVTSSNVGNGSIELDYLDNTTTTLGHNPAATNVGQQVTFTATVKDHAGATIGNKGSVTLYEFTGGQTCDALGGATALAGPTNLTNNPSGEASFQTSALAAGTHVITACYSGTSAFTKSFGSVSHVVTAALTATNLTADPATGTYGGQVNLSATLKAGTTALSGKTVSFTLNGNAVGSATTNGSGVATLSNVFLTSNGTSGGTRIGVNTYASGVGASYAGEAGPPAFGSSNGTAQLKVDPKSVDPSFTADNKVYDGGTGATILTRSLTGVLGTDNVTLTGGTANFANKNVGTGKTVTATGFTLGGTAAGNYTLSSTSATTTADITAKPLTGSITAANKIYDGTDAATILTRTLSGVIVGDVVSAIGGTATFNNKNVGNGKPVTATGLTLDGTDKLNYSFSGTATGTANITVRSLTVTATGVDKQYDGTTTATVILADDRIGGDMLTTAYTAANFADKHVGTAKHISVTGISINGGADAGNYTLGNTTASATADITQRPLTVTATGINKVYDGTTGASVTLSDDRIGGDVFTTSYTSAVFTDKNAGNGKTINVTGISISGTDAGNYTFNTTTTATANITKRPITVTAAADTKQYDGNTSSAGTPTITSGTLAPGDVAAFTQTFDNKNVGTSKTLTPAGAVTDGNGGNNYYVTFATNTNGEITPRPLAVTATGINKVYDGTTAATVTLSDDRISGDMLTLGYTSASFIDKNVGNGKTVNVSGISVSGTDAGNYTHNTTATTTANITALSLVVNATAADKYYDGTTTATVTLSAVGVLPGDVVTPINYASANFNNAMVGTGKTVTVTGISLGGVDGPNYAPNTTAMTTASIKAWTLTGFYQPVDMPMGGLVWNTVKGGSTVPLKFQVFIGSMEQTNTVVVKSFVAMPMACGTSGTSADIEFTTTGATVLRYSGDQFIQNWQTPKLPNNCYKVIMTTQDDSNIYAYFKLK